MHWAAEAGHGRMVRLLAGRGAAPDARDAVCACVERESARETETGEGETEGERERHGASCGLLLVLSPPLPTPHPANRIWGEVGGVRD